ncbi:MAG: hypothetical protein Kow0047_26960 [Anaerolineae bacterium]
MRRLRGDLIAALVLLVIPLAWFAPVLTGQRTLLPVDNLFAWEPWRSFAAQVGVDLPHNELLSDLILENYPWKRFIRQSLAAREIPLWNPYLFSGVPFLAAGQHSGLYPLSVLFWILPIDVAYGWFTALQIALAGLSMYAFVRAWKLSPGAALIAGVAYMLSGFFMVSVVFTMMIAAAAWLPALLACIETVIRKQEDKGPIAYSPVPYIVCGGVVLGLQVLAGHIEITVYVLLVSALYAAWRLAGLWRRLRTWRPPVRLGVWLLAMVVAGLALAGIQLLPLYELAQRNFRQGAAGYHVTYEDVIGWAWPVRQVLTFFIPDIFGNPSHHGYWDLWSRQWQPVTTNALGEPVRAIFWGVKNYVEGGNYLGLLVMALAAIGMLAGLSGRFAEDSARRRQLAAFLLLLAGVSLGNAFGTPTYALFYYGLPWLKQLHSPFRWVFPLTLCAAMLAALGYEAIRSRAAWGPWLRRAAWAVTGMPALGGLAALLLVALSLARPEPFFALGQRVLDGSDLARMAYPDGRTFWAYQALNLLKFGAMAVASAVALGGLIRARRPRLWAVLTVAVLALDMWLAFGRFNPATDRRLLDFTPPSIAWLQERLDEPQGPWRFTTLNAPGEKTLNANAAWLFGLQDVRGYDSIIPRQYAEYMDRIQPQFGELLYNRIAPIYTEGRGPSGYQALDSPWLRLLGVRYVVTTQEIPNPTYELAHDGEVRIYRAREAMPRAFMMACRSSAAVAEIDWGSVDPTVRLVLEAEDAVLAAEKGEILPDRFLDLRECQLTSASVVSYSNNEVVVRALAETDGAYLVLADAYFPGWKAYRLVEGGNEEALPIYRAYGNFRAVPLVAGEQTIRFRYSPMSFKLGIYVSFLGAVTLFLAFGWWAWGRYYREEEGGGAEVRRVAKNSLIPMGLSLLNKGIDFAFAMLRLRVLSPAGEGSYTFAISFYTFFEILVRFGLGTLLTREVARDREQASRYLSNVVTLRIILWLVALPVMALVGAAYRLWGGLTVEEAQAIALFTVALLLAGLADAISAVFNAYEKMEYPAGVASAIAVTKVALGALVLLPPLEWGFVGLAGVSVVMNLVQMVWLYALLREKLGVGVAGIDRPLQRMMLNESAPLMINHLLATIFFRIDVWILKPFSGAGAVGLYGAAYKYIDGLNVIPSYFTLAIFPLMSRYARDARESLVRAYILALRLLVMISLPIAVVTTFIARPLIFILGGEQYLPGSAWALQILIWSIPVGFINSVTQYVLIAVDQQRFLTRAFLIGVAFNTLFNLLLVPRFSYLAAAAVTIFSEVALLIPFYAAVRRHVAPVPWWDVLWRPVVAAAAMAIVLWGLAGVSLVAGVLASVVAYVAVLVVTGTFRETEMAWLASRMPWARGRIAPSTADRT